MSNADSNLHKLRPGEEGFVIQIPTHTTELPKKGRGLQPHSSHSLTLTWSVEDLTEPSIKVDATKPGFDCRRDHRYRIAGTANDPTGVRYMAVWGTGLIDATTNVEWPNHNATKEGIHVVVPMQSEALNVNSHDMIIRMDPPINGFEYGKLQCGLLVTGNGTEHMSYAQSGDIEFTLYADNAEGVIESRLLIAHPVG